VGVFFIETLCIVFAHCTKCDKRCTLKCLMSELLILIKQNFC